MERPDEGTGPRLTVERLTCRITLPEGLALPLAARERIVRIAERELPGACAKLLDRLPDQGAVYRIRRLQLDLWANLEEAPEAQIAERWASLLVTGAARAIARGLPSQVRRFDSAQHLVASFLGDLVDGSAWSQWYYDEFRALEPLPLPRLALELLAPRPGWIAPTLRALGERGRLDPLLERWGEREIAALWRALGFPGAPALAPRAAEEMPALRAAWEAAALSGGADADARARDRLRLWLALAERDPSRALDPDFGALAHAAVELASWLRETPELAPLLWIETAPDPALARRSPWWPELAASPAGRRTLAQLAAVVRGRAEPAARADGWALASPVGGAFLLVPALAELGLWARWRDELGEPAARRCLFILALKALGRERAPLHQGDPLLAALAGLDEPPVADLRRAPEPDGPAGAWAWRLPAAGRWQAPRLQAAMVGKLRVIREGTTGCWLGAWPGPAPDPRAVIDGWPGLAGAPLAEPDAAAQQALEAEARHLQLGQGLGYPWLTPSLDAALSAAASLALRRLAAMLPGLGQASPAYLARQFLAQPATLRAGGDAWTVRLSGGPLAVVLRLAPLPEVVEAPWLPRPLRLTLAREG